MTTLSKILVFINLLFSLLTGAMIVMVFATRTNWKTGYEGLSNQLKIERSNYLNLQQSKFDLEKEKNLQVAKLQGDYDALDKEIKVLKQQRDQALVKAAQAEAAAAKFGHIEKNFTSTADTMKAEVKSLDERLVKEQERVKELGLQNKEYKAEAIKARTDLETALERNRQLLAKLIETEKKLQNSQDTSGSKTAQETKNPPPEDVRGRVTATDDSAGWVTINLGSDNGINKGNTMEIFRIKPKPTYVGTLRIYEVRANEAVGKLVGAGARGRVQKDDEVASRILGSP